MKKKQKVNSSKYLI